MEVGSVLNFSKYKHDTLFKRSGLDEKVLAKLDRSVASAKKTLELADSLQIMRDAVRILQTGRGGRSAAPSSSFSLPNILDIKI
jgi:hypothetical protein